MFTQDFNNIYSHILMNNEDSKYFNHLCKQFYFNKYNIVLKVYQIY